LAQLSRFTALLIIEEIRHHRAIKAERAHQSTLISRLMAKNLPEFTEQAKILSGPSKSELEATKLNIKSLKVENELAIKAAEIEKFRSEQSGYPVT